MNFKQKTNRYGGFAIADKLYTGVVLLLLLLIISGWPPYTIKAKSAGDIKWAPDGDLIPIRAIERIAQKRFVIWAENDVVVEAVRKANDNNHHTMDQIIQLDKEWVQGLWDKKRINSLLNNKCVEYLREMQNVRNDENSLYAEIFVTDKHGCIVAGTKKTSDYWQGDEDKFVKAFAGGKGAVFIDESNYDESTGSTSIQVSVPVYDPDTQQAIGVMTVALDICVLDKQI